VDRDRLSAPLSGIASLPRRLDLRARLGIVAAVLLVEMLLVSYLTPLDLVTGPAEVMRHIQHWLFRFVIAYSVSLGMLIYLRGAAFRAVSGLSVNAPVRIQWWVIHAVLLLLLGFLSAELYGAATALPFAALAAAWHVCAIAAALALFAAMAPAPVWLGAARRCSGLPLFALLPAAAAVAAIQGSQLLWAPASELTFRLIQLLLQSLRPTLHVDPATLTLATDRFSVTIAQACSGLEGVGLMLAFCAAWLWCFRREYYFPRALLVVPIGVLLVFLLNAVRIAALVLIADAGYEGIATVGFHSQAGWIGFNLVAFGVALLARRNSWINRSAHDSRAGAAASAAHAPTVNPTAAYLMPLLIILAAGTIARILSPGFDLLYPLRFAAALAVLWFYRRSYAALDWSCSWRAGVVGAMLFCLWAGSANFLTTPSAEPHALLLLPAPLRVAWIGCRVFGAILTVPLAEELAYRGYLMRRLISPRFESVALADVRWPALALSALAFGAMHGALWLPGIVSGWAYGALAIKTGKLGEAVAAHATTNGLLAIYVLRFDQWQLW
jgi:exosortase E/protease (VPEID-CTERM system)